MYILDSEQLGAVVGGAGSSGSSSGSSGSSTQQPATQTGTDSNGNPTYSCPTGTFPSQLPNGQVVCVKPNQ